MQLCTVVSGGGGFSYVLWCMVGQGVLWCLVGEGVAVYCGIWWGEGVAVYCGVWRGRV